VSISRLALVLPLFIGLAVAPSIAEAKPSKGAAAAESLPVIQPTGIPEFDEVFLKAKAIHDTLDAQDAELKTARTALTTALGVAEDAPIATALADLKTKANGKLKLVMKGKTPRLEASDAVPENVQTAIAAVNTLLDAGEKSIDASVGLVDQAKQLATACAGFPAKLPSVIQDPSKLLSAGKLVKDDVKATAATPDRVDRLMKSTEAIFTDLKGAFAE
jgi:hypothetical protein